MQTLRNSQQHSEALVTEELAALRASLDYQLLPAYRQELEREMAGSFSGAAAEASAWAVQACIALRFLRHALEEVRSGEEANRREMSKLHQQVAVLLDKCETLQVHALLARARGAGGREMGTGVCLGGGGHNREVLAGGKGG